MNYLAHLFLAKQSSLGLVGALMGDFLREVDRDSLPFELRESITHHLAIDTFTDSHVLVRNLKQKFSQRRRRFSGIIIDVTFDHFLLKHWNTFSHDSSDVFIMKSYGELSEHISIMPPRMKHVIQLLVKHDVLSSYQNISGVGTAINRIADRLSRETALYDSVDEVELLYAEIEECFLHFFEELQRLYGDGRMGIEE